nr:putative capsid [Marmot picobirnavirus]
MKNEKRKGTENEQKQEQGSQRSRKSNSERKKDKSKSECQNQGDKRNGGNTPLQDPFWYAKDDNAVKDIASLPFLETLGEPLTPVASGDAVPGVMVLQYKPTIGSDSTIADSGTNYKTRGANAYFQYVTQGFTGGVDFEAPDLLMGALAGESLIALMEEGRRAYGVTKYYLQQNNTYASTAVRALNFDYDDLCANLADFRAEFNIRVDQINKTVAIPKSFAIGDRWEFISRYIFTDTDNPEWSSAIAWQMTAALQYNPVKLTTGTCLTWLKLPSTMTVDEYFAQIDTLINALTDDDVRSMFGSIRRVYAESDLRMVEQLNEDYLTPVLRHDIVSAQVHNACWSNDLLEGWAPNSLLTVSSENTEDVAVYQTANGGIHAKVLHVTTSEQDDGPTSSVLLDMYDHLAEPGNILDITANIQVPAGRVVSATPTGSTADANLLVCRSEALERVLLYNPGTTMTVPKCVNIGGSTLPNELQAIARASHVDSHPLIYFYSSNAATPQVYRFGFIAGEINKYTIVGTPVLAKMHEKTQYQLLSMPSNSKSVTR